MDRKTLEYMKERVTKAEKIIQKIEELTRIANGLIRYPENADTTIRVQNRYLNTSPKGSHTRLHTSIISSVHQLIADEIALLEQELAEL